MCYTLSSIVVLRTKFYFKLFEEERGKRKKEIERKFASHHKGLRISNKQNKVANYDGWGKGGYFLKFKNV